MNRAELESGDGMQLEIIAEACFMAFAKTLEAQLPAGYVATWERLSVRQRIAWRAAAVAALETGGHA